ncbi:MAG: hypothetical protein IJL87_10125 [Clostridia bacterium]|nr:hypothetical protein [Clostridia bacterium]
MPRSKSLGDIVEIELPDGKKAYGRVYREYTVGIFNGFYGSVEELDISVGYYRFIGLYRTDLNKLRTAAKLPFSDTEDPWPPDKVVVDAITGKGSLYHHGQIFPCSYEECKNLEVCAVWHTYHVIDMLMGNEKWDKTIRKPLDV